LRKINREKFMASSPSVLLSNRGLSHGAETH
jgi:hypothetical protein